MAEIAAVATLCQLKKTAGGGGIILMAWCGTYCGKYVFSPQQQQQQNIIITTHIRLDGVAIVTDFIEMYPQDVPQIVLLSFPAAPPVPSSRAIITADNYFAEKNSTSQFEEIKILGRFSISAAFQAQSNYSLDMKMYVTSCPPSSSTHNTLKYFPEDSHLDHSLI